LIQLEIEAICEDVKAARPRGMREPNRGEEPNLSTRGLLAALPATTDGPPYCDPLLAMVADHEARFTPLADPPTWQPEPPQEAAKMGCTCMEKLTTVGV